MKDEVSGTIAFLAVKLPILKMDLLIIRKEIIGAGDKAITFTDEVSSFEIMDGCPIKGYIIRGRNSCSFVS